MRNFEKITLTSDQLDILDKLGVNLKGKDLKISVLAGMLPVIRPVDAPMEEEIIICVSGC